MIRAAGARNLAGAGRDGHDRALARPAAGEGPEHRGHDLERATTQLEGAGLDVSIVKRRYDDEIPEGSVIEQRQTGMVPSGSTVEVVVSKGHAPVEVPKVAGMSETEASDALQALGFTVRTEEAFPTASSGFVIGASPNAGEETAYASTVTLKVSLGPERFQAPSFIGLHPRRCRGPGRGVRPAGVGHRPPRRHRGGDHPEPRAGRDGQLRRHDPALPAVRFGAHVRRGRKPPPASSSSAADVAPAAPRSSSRIRAWAPPSFSDEAAARFRDAWTTSGLGPLAAHAPR